MKSIAALVTLMLIVLTGGLYLVLRKKENKLADWQNIRDKFTAGYNRVAKPFRSAGAYVNTLFASKDEKAAAA
jgi:hypothetical protein